jgi:hypothetical protein
MGGSERQNAAEYQTQTPKKSSVSSVRDLFLRRYSSNAFFFSSSRYRIRLLISVFIEW